MRIIHQSGISYIEGSKFEQVKIDRWIEEAQKIDEHILIAADESYEEEICIAIVRKYSTQEERQETFQRAKLKI